jgi:hypothetical protein
MHKSLKPSTNVLLIVGFLAVVIVGMAIPAAPSRLLVAGIGAALGLVAGLLQLRAIEEKKDLLLAADSALAVRSAMTASMAGRFAIYAVWFAIVLLFAIAFLQSEGLPFRVLTGYAAFALLRDVVALKGCFDLQRAYQAKKANQSPEPTSGLTPGRGSS